MTESSSEAQTCGSGIAEHGSVPAAIGIMFDGLAQTLELHRQMLVLSDPKAQHEDAVYRDLAASWREIAQLVEKAAAKMIAQRGLPMGAHDETAWGEAHVRAFERFVSGQRKTLALLTVAVERDEKMLASMTKPT
jgi:hypothetical protein